MTQTFKTITTFVIYGHEYHIMYTAQGWEGDPNDNHYCAFKDEWIDENGCLNRQVNGLDMAISHSVKEVLQHIKNREEMDHLMQTEGVDVMEACRLMIERQLFA